MKTSIPAIAHMESEESRHCEGNTTVNLVKSPVYEDICVFLSTRVLHLKAFTLAIAHGRLEESGHSEESIFLQI